MFFSGHDCYISASVKDAFIDKGVPSWSLYKYAYNPVYTKSKENYETLGRCLFSRRYVVARENAKRPGWKRLSNKAARKLDRLTTEYQELNYMTGDFSEFDYSTVCGDLKLNYLDSHKCFLSHRQDQSISDGDMVFVLALHSFADEACIYGIDDFHHMIEYFRLVSEAITSKFPTAYLAVRFHPNTLVYDDNPHEMTLKDRALQARLFRTLESISNRIVISCCGARLEQIDKNFRTCMVTRWGSIGLECMHLNIPVVCSPLASYSTLLSDEQVMDRRENICAKIELVGNKVAASESFDYDKEGLANLCASIFFTPNGEQRYPHFSHSSEGKAYLRVRFNASGSESTESRTFRLMEYLLSRQMFRRYTTLRLRRYLVNTAETIADRRIIKERLGW